MATPDAQPPPEAPPPRTRGLGHYPVPEPEPVSGPPAPRPARRLPWRRRVPWQNLSLVLAGVLVSLLATLAYSSLQSPQPRMTQRDVATAVAKVMASATPVPSTASRVYGAIAPSVVLVHTWGDKDHQDEAGIGSGVVIDEAGSVLTCLHVVTRSSEIEIFYADGTRVNAIIAGMLPDKDIAMLQPVDQPPMAIPAVMGSPGALNVGDEVVAVGNPFGLRHTVTAGVVSGLERTFRLPDTEEVVPGLIQFDAAVNPGNSGGPLLNRDGEVVGIVIGLANPTTDTVFIGIGFAVPIETAAEAGGPLPF